MKKIHEKSACCRASSIKFGAKRRQCTWCRRTWTLWSQRRGRKRKRVSVHVVERFLEHVPGSAYGRARHRSCSPRSMTRDILRSRDLLNRTYSWSSPPDTDTLILVVDAVIKQVAGTQWTAYCFFARAPHKAKAVILPPVILPGGETQTGWNRAFAMLSPLVRRRIRAIVCDGHRGPVNYAKRHAWLIQRCHFHLIAALQGRRSRWARGRHRDEGRRVFALVREALVTQDERRCAELAIDIDNLALSTTSPQLRRALRGFANNRDDFRTYLHHPELNLPTTSNTAESFISSIEELCHRLRGFPTESSIKLWIEALAKFKRTITCNGCHQQKN